MKDFTLTQLCEASHKWLCGSRISHGMSCEIIEAERIGIPVRSLSAEQIQGGCHMKQLSYDDREREILPEETPSPGLKLQI